jgi:TonB family protein
MTKRTWVIALNCCLIALTATAQDGARIFRDAVVKHQLYLRDFSMDSHVRGHWDAAANTLVMDNAKIHSLAAFMAKSVKVKGSNVEIKGFSQVLARDTATHTGLIPDKNDMVIQLDLRGADMNTVLPGLAGLLFYHGQSDALAAIPKIYRNVLPMRVDDTCCGTPIKTLPGAGACDCAQHDAESCGRDAMGTPKGAKPPHVLYQVDPEFSEKARHAKFSGNVQVGLEVDSTGTPHDLWIIRAAGMGLDEAAGDAVSQYKFAPATCRGTPIAVTLSIEVNFQIF